MVVVSVENVVEISLKLSIGRAENVIIGSMTGAVVKDDSLAKLASSEAGAAVCASSISLGIAGWGVTLSCDDITHCLAQLCLIVKSITHRIHPLRGKILKDIFEYRGVS